MRANNEERGKGMKAVKDKTEEPNTWYQSPWSREPKILRKTMNKNII